MSFQANSATANERCTSHDQAGASAASPGRSANLEINDLSSDPTLQDRCPRPISDNGQRSEASDIAVPSPIHVRPYDGPYEDISPPALRRSSSISLRALEANRPDSSVRKSTTLSVVGSSAKRAWKVVAGVIAVVGFAVAMSQYAA
ncbi:hypothetical protein CAC42_6324 [Sphaceloma murrayae]|uniref:Uncharacterized protein n=1 Tax=Sphaceloma murrayae TaxID=2082308 RepID=A0A2K1QM29_9PEZI|nr:hypothetical protein CAC42_6324 [Sphaceloma murrayae]